MMKVILETISSWIKLELRSLFPDDWTFSFTTLFENNRNKYSHVNISNNVSNWDTAIMYDLDSKYSIGVMFTGRDVDIYVPV